MPPPLILFGFFGSAAVIVAAGTSLARSGDVIAARTSLGGLWVGSVFLAIATSLPEATTDVAAVLMGLPDLAAGDLFGSSMANMLILAVISMTHGAELFRRAALDNAISAALAIILTTIAAIAVLLESAAAILRIGPGSLVILSVYLVGTRAIYRRNAVAHQAGQVAEMAGEPPHESGAERRPTLRRTVWSFAGATVVLLIAGPLFAGFADQLAEATGLGATFVGTSLVGLATSLPELVTSLTAVRMGAYDLAVGNLFGSNAVNMLMFVPLDAVHLSGPVLAAVHPAHAVSALVAVVLMAIGLSAIVSRARRRMSMLEPSSGLILLGYILGMAIVYTASAATR